MKFLEIIYKFRFYLFFIPLFTLNAGKVELGVDIFFKNGGVAKLQGKRVGLITNQTGIDSQSTSTSERFLQHQNGYKLVAFFSPEHGIDGSHYAAEKVEHCQHAGIPVFSLHGKTRRPTPDMLKDIDILIFDIQDIGVRSYTYCTTLFYMMEEAAKHQIPLIVLDRPNPIGGEIVDGPMLETEWRSFIGYIDVPYCHGMTIGELARFFNTEYKINCALTVVPMRGWKRSMRFQDTGLSWVPTSPHIPEADTPLFYASTGILGELGLISIGVGYTLPFKVVGAPWVDAHAFARALNDLKLPGVLFRPFYFRPFYGEFRGKNCQGVLILVENHRTYRPLTVQFALIGILKSLYPQPFNKALSAIGPQKKELFCKAVGSSRVLELLEKERFVTYKLFDIDKEKIEIFKIKRTKYLLPDY